MVSGLHASAVRCACPDPTRALGATRCTSATGAHKRLADPQRADRDLLPFRRTRVPRRRRTDGAIRGTALDFADAALVLLVEALTASFSPRVPSRGGPQDQVPRHARGPKSYGLGKTHQGSLTTVTACT